MTYIYNIMMAVILVLGFLLSYKGQTKRKNLILLGVSLVMLAGVAAIRYEVGDDYYNYMMIYNLINDMPLSQFFTYNYEPGFFLWCKFIQLFTANFQWFYASSAIATTALVFLFIYKESKLPVLSVYLYMSMMFYYWSLSLMRQIFAASICVLSVKFIREKKFIPFLLIVLLAASFHKSALILLPVFFIAQIKFNWKSVSVLGGIALICFIFAPTIMQFVVKTLNISSYTDVSKYAQGSSLVYGIFPTLVFIAAWCFKKKLLDQDPTNNVYLNLMFYAAVISLFIARVFIVERFAVYFFLPAIVLLPNMVMTLQAPQEKLKAIEDAKAEQKQLKGTALKVKQQELARLSGEVKDSRAFFGFAAGCVIVLTLFYHLFGFSNNFYKVKDYQTIFNKQPTAKFSAQRQMNKDYLDSIGYPSYEVK